MLDLKNDFRIKPNGHVLVTNTVAENVQTGVKTELVKIPEASFEGKIRYIEQNVQVPVFKAVVRIEEIEFIAGDGGEVDLLYQKWLKDGNEVKEVQFTEQEVIKERSSRYDNPSYIDALMKDAADRIERGEKTHPDLIKAVSAFQNIKTSLPKPTAKKRKV